MRKVFIIEQIVKNQFGNNCRPQTFRHLKIAGYMKIIYTYVLVEIRDINRMGIIDNQ